MPHRGRKKEWAVVLFVGVLVVLFPPVISIYDRPDLVLGLPLSYLVLFALWAMVILATALSTRNILLLEDNDESSEVVKQDLEDLAREQADGADRS